MDKLWFYTKSGSTEKLGPVPEAEIRALLGAGTLSMSDLVWSDGMSNWQPLGTVPAFRGSAPSASAATPAGGAGLPPGLTGWMGFVGVMNIIMGVFSALSCVGILSAVFMIIGGVALIAGKNALAGVTEVDSSLSVFFDKLKTFIQMTGIMYIIGLIMTVVMMVLWFSMFAAALASATGAPH